MQRDQIIHFADREEAQKWSLSYISDFAMKHLWYPKYEKLSDLGLYLFFHNYNKWYNISVNYKVKNNRT